MSESAQLKFGFISRSHVANGNLFTLHLYNLNPNGLSSKSYRLILLRHSHIWEQTQQKENTCSVHGKQFGKIGLLLVLLIYEIHHHLLPIPNIHTLPRRRSRDGSITS